MKTRLLWTLILSIGSAAMYFGIVRPEVPTEAKRIREYLEKDPATLPPVELPPLVVSESRISGDPPSPDRSPVDVAGGKAGSGPTGAVR